MDIGSIKQVIFKEDRITTGIEALDVALDGGYKNPGIVVLLGHLVKEKDCIGGAFLGEGTYNLYISTNKEIEFLKECRQRGVKVRVDRFIDVYSGKSGMEGKVVYIKSPSALSDISLEIGEFLKKTEEVGLRPKILINSFSDLLFYNPLNSILRFLQFLGSRLKDKGGTLMLVADPEVKKDELNVALNTADQVFMMRKEGEKVWLESEELPFPAQVVVERGVRLL